VVVAAQLVDLVTPAATVARVAEPASAAIAGSIAPTASTGGITIIPTGSPAADAPNNPSVTAGGRYAANLRRASNRGDP